MAPARRSTIGRSPLVNQQRQITSFFSKSSTSSPSPSPPPLLSQNTPKSNPNPSPSPSPSPTTPSPVDTKRKKPFLVIAPPSPKKLVFSEEVVNRRVRVYWPLDKSWYEGCVKSFDKISGKHLVQYDDAEEELLDLVQEKIEWVGEEVSRKFRRLRRVSVVEEDVELEEEPEGDDDLDDEDWGKNAEAEVEEEEEVLVDMDLEDEDDDDVDDMGKLKGKGSVLGKRKTSRGDKVGVSKKSKSKVDAGKSTSMNVVDGNGGKFIQPKDNVGT